MAIWTDYSKTSLRVPGEHNNGARPPRYTSSVAMMKKYSALFWGRYYRPLLPILLLFVPSYGAAPRSYNINGIFYDKPEEMQVSPADIIDGESCFSGLGITNCKHIPQGWSLSDFNFDEYVGDAWAAPDLGSTPFHWTNVFADPNGNKLPFCIECCSNSRTN